MPSRPPISSLVHGGHGAQGQPGEDADEEDGIAGDKHGQEQQLHRRVAPLAAQLAGALEGHGGAPPARALRARPANRAVGRRCLRQPSLQLGSQLHATAKQPRN